MQHYIDVVQDRSGNVIGGAIVLITDNSTGLPVTVYSDAGGSIVLPTVTTDVNGTFSFYAPSGRYNFVVIKNGTTLKIVNDVDIPYDIGVLSASTGSTLIGTTNGGTGAVTRTVASKLNDTVSVKDFGAVGDGVTDDAVAFTNALVYMASLGGGNLYIPADNFYINSSLTIPNGCVIVGALALTSPRSFDGNLHLYAQLQLGAGCTINLSSASSIVGCCILRYGLTYPATAASIAAEWNGIAVTVLAGGNGASISNCFIGGFNIGFSSLGNSEKVRIANCAMDCIGGVRMYNNGDNGYINLVHIWPFLSIAAAPAVGKRSGPAFDIGCSDAASGASGLRIEDCFSFGHQIGYNLSAVASAGGNNATLINCWADNNQADDSDAAIGFKITEYWNNVTLIGCTGSGARTGVLVNNSQAMSCVQISSSNFFGSSSNTLGSGITITAASSVLINDNYFQNLPFGVKNNSTSPTVPVVINSNIFDFCYTNPVYCVSTATVLLNGNDFSEGNGANSIAASTYYNASVAIGTTLQPPPSSDFCFLSGSATIYHIDTYYEYYIGKKLTIISAAGTWTLVTGTDFLLNGGVNFVAAANDTITLMWTGSVWLEVARSIRNTTTIIPNLSTTADALIHGLTVGLGGGSVSTNMAFGAAALATTNTGFQNTSIGYWSQGLSSSGSNNTSIGYATLQNIVSTNGNTVVGSRALNACTGAGNNAFGFGALIAVTSGNYNCAYGYFSGSAITTGSNNVVIGAYTGSAAPISATGSNYIVLSDGAGNVRQVIDSSGNVGIGTSSPAFKLDVVNNINGSAGGCIRNANAGASAYTSILLGNDVTTNQGLILNSTTNTGYAGASSMSLWQLEANPIGIVTNNLLRMIVDGSGNVGIGTSSPNASAILDAQSTTKGVRFPNMTTTQKTAISSPAAGLVVFDTTLAKLCLYTGASWQTITSV